MQQQALNLPSHAADDDDARLAEPAHRGVEAVARLARQATRRPTLPLRGEDEHSQRRRELVQNQERIAPQTSDRRGSHLEQRHARVRVRLNRHLGGWQGRWRAQPQR